MIHVAGGDFGGVTRTLGCAVEAGGPADGLAPGGASLLGGGEVGEEKVGAIATSVKRNRVFFFSEG